MIKSLEIQNIQSHEDTKLDFHPGVNVIIGSSDSGKTTIIRSLRKLVWNRPSGNALHSNWKDAGNSAIKLATNEGAVVWSKDKIDKYELTIPGQKTLEFTAFATTVPQEISNFLNIDEVNLQNQLDAPFLLSETPGVVASYLNKVARLDQIDIGISNINKWITGIKDLLNYKKGQLASEQVKLEKFNYLTDFEADVKTLEGLEKESDNIQAKYDQLSKLLQNIKSLDKRIEEEQQILKAEPLVDEILRLIKERKEVQTKHDKLCKLLNDIDVIQEQLDSYNNILIAEPIVIELLTLYKSRDAIEADRSKLTRLVQDIKQNQLQLTQTQKKYDKLHQEFEDEFPDVCPLCGKLK
jgi:exonuclease SbcC